MPKKQTFVQNIMFSPFNDSRVEMNQSVGSLVSIVVSAPVYKAGDQGWSWEVNLNLLRGLDLCPLK